MLLASEDGTMDWQAVQGKVVAGANCKYGLKQFVYLPCICLTAKNNPELIFVKTHRTTWILLGNNEHVM